MIPVISILFAICLPVFALHSHENKHSLKYPYIFLLQALPFAPQGLLQSFSQSNKGCLQEILAELRIQLTLL
ncbi:MAG: hypothetical protein HFE62_02540 [Firmicutes bacterium]|nr:hypothetical protein [Bacillota bacterium]